MHDPYAAQKANAHFCVRAFERHGILLRDKHIHEIIRSIKERESVFIKWSHNGYRAFYRVMILDAPYIVLYDVEIDALVTIYHHSWFKLENGEWVPTRKFRKGIRRGAEKW